MAGQQSLEDDRASDQWPLYVLGLKLTQRVHLEKYHAWDGLDDHFLYFLRICDILMLNDWYKGVQKWPFLPLEHTLFKYLTVWYRDKIKEIGL